MFLQLEQQCLYLFAHFCIPQNPVIDDMHRHYNTTLLELLTADDQASVFPVESVTSTHVEVIEHNE